MLMLTLNFQMLGMRSRPLAAFFLASTIGWMDWLPAGK
jgi:hypothetical protein